MDGGGGGICGAGICGAGICGAGIGCAIGGGIWVVMGGDCGRGICCVWRLAGGAIGGAIVGGIFTVSSDRCAPICANPLSALMMPAPVNNTAAKIPSDRMFRQFVCIIAPYFGRSAGTDGRAEQLNQQLEI
jgi:hypothetical protein